MFDLLATLLGTTPEAFEARIDAAMAACEPDTSMPPPPTDAQLTTLGLSPEWYAAQMQDTAWWDADGFYHSS